MASFRIEILCSKILVIALVGSSVLNLESRAESCKESQAKSAVEKICDLIAEKGKRAASEIFKFRYCGYNYVWVHNSRLERVIHPILSKRVQRDLRNVKDDMGKAFPKVFRKMALANPEGGWVDYHYSKPGKNQKPSLKRAFVKLCPGPLGWVAGSGVWID